MRLATPASAATINAPTFAYGWPTNPTQAHSAMRPAPMRPAPMRRPVQAAPAPRTTPRAATTSRSKQASTMRALLCFFAFWVIASFGFVMLFVERLGA